MCVRGTAFFAFFNGSIGQLVARHVQIYRLVDDGKNRALVGLGSYVVNTSGCNDCHTHPSYLPSGDPFQGFPEMLNYQQYMTGGRQFKAVTRTK